MKTKVLLFILTLILASCNKEEDIRIEDLNLAQTAWKGNYAFKEESKDMKGTVLISFTSTNEGEFSMENIYEVNNSFNYTHKENQVTISHILLGGEWIIASTGKNTIKLTRFVNYKETTILELERIDNQ